MKVVWILVHAEPYEGDRLLGVFATEQALLAHTPLATKRYDDAPLVEPRESTYADSVSGDEYWCEMVVGA